MREYGVKAFYNVENIIRTRKNQIFLYLDHILLIRFFDHEYLFLLYYGSYFFSGRTMGILTIKVVPCPASLTTEILPPSFSIIL